MVALPQQLSAILGHVALGRGWTVEDLSAADLERQDIDRQRNVLVVFLHAVSRPGLALIARAVQRQEARVLVVSPDRHPQHIADAFAAGADDYLVEPVNVVEWVARVERLIQLASRERQESRQLLLDDASRSISFGSSRVTFTPREWEALQLLIQAGEHAEAQDARCVRPYTVQRLRRKLSAHGIHELSIRNVYGRGYVAKHITSGADARGAPEPPRAPASRTAAGDPCPRDAHQAGRGTP